MAPSVILFDCFGVLVEDGWGLIDGTLRPSTAQWQQLSAISHACDTGVISYKQLYASFAEVLDVPLPRVERIISAQRKNYPLLEFIEHKLRPQYRIGILSNVGRDFLKRFFTKKERDLFEHIIMSSSVGYSKPQPQIYSYAAQQFGVEPHQCLLIDDSPANVAGAESAGMQATYYRDFEHLRQDLTNANVEFAS